MHSRIHASFVAAVVLLAAANAPTAGAQTLNIDLGVYWGSPSGTYGAALGLAGTWNSVGTGTATDLIDVNGAVTYVSITVTASNDDGWWTTCSGDAQALLSDNVFSTSSTGANTWEVSLGGVSPGWYAVVLYAPDHPSVPTGAMTVNGVGVESLPGIQDCGFDEGLSHAVVQVEVGPSSTLTVVGDTAGTTFGYAGLAGLQLVPSLIFADGFEGGDTSAWDVAMP
jgi:hypothetical protein